MNARGPFRVERAGATLTLTLDTPGASVNVFGPEAAEQLGALLGALPTGVERLVLRSAKPGSFVNGAGLLYAHAMQSREVALATSAPVRAVYERLAAARPTTVAWIEGNCFGCGLELALCCDVRLARDVPPTEFRMTELTDYRFVPLFGGTWRLPRRVGRRAAAALLLEGEVWDARRALAAGLVDAVLPAEASEQDVRVQLESARTRTPPGPGAAEAPLTVPEVPPTRRALWALGAGLLEEGAEGPEEAARGRELEAFARTVTAPEAKRAMAYFFTKHAARAATLGNASREPPERALPEGFAIPLRRTPQRLAAAWLFPAPSLRACELSVARDALAEGRAWMRALEWRGVDVVLTCGGGRFVSRRLLARSRQEAAALRRAGVSPARLNAALWAAGFDHPFRWRGWPSAREGGADPGLVLRFARVWQAALDSALADGWLLHPSQGEVIAQLWLAFPLEEERLSRWLKRHTGAARARAG